MHVCLSVRHLVEMTTGGTRRSRMTAGETMGAGGPPRDLGGEGMCVHTYMHMYMHTATHVCVYIHIYVSEYVYVYTHTFPLTNLHCAKPQRGQDAAAASPPLGYQT